MRAQALSEKTHFGFEQVAPEEKARRVRGVFESVAGKYDLMNDLMSAGLHRAWKRFTVETSGVREGARVLDVAGGTADLARLFADRVGSTGSVVLTDINGAMLAAGRDRLLNEGRVIPTVQCNAEALPFPESSFTHVLAADLLENTRSPAAAIRCAASVLEEGGFMFVSSSNRRWIGPHPATGVWAAGWLPRPLRAALLRRKHGIDILRAVSFVSPGSVRRVAKAAGLRQLCAKPLAIDADRVGHRSKLFRVLARTYAMLMKAPVFRSVLLAAGPVFQSLFVKETMK